MIEKIVILALYAIMILVVGYIGMRKTKSFHDFFLGGGNVGPWFSAFSYATAYFSAVVFIGFAGKIGWGFGFSFPSPTRRFGGKISFPSLVRIDHIFYSDHFYAARARTVSDSAGSDHRPVIADLIPVAGD